MQDLDPTERAIYCFSYKSGEVEKQNSCIKALGENTECNPCRDNAGTCDTLKEYLKRKIVNYVYESGVRIQFCAYEGNAKSKKDYQCLKGKKIDQSKYLRQGSISCTNETCERYFNQLKKKNNWPDSCDYKLGYKKYTGYEKKDEF
jgi:hypothetical protein